MIELVYPKRPAPVVRGAKTASSKEMVPIVEATGVVTAQAPRGHCHIGSHLLHPVVHLNIIRRDGAIYLQKRSASKKAFPLMWDFAVGGHVSYGEQILEALAREASEEIGLVNFTPIPLASYVWQTESEDELVNSFAVVGSFELNPDGKEVEDGRWWTSAEIEEKMGAAVFTPSFIYEYSMVKSKLEALL